MNNHTPKGRMHELVGKAREEDEQFWQQLGFREADSDEDYVESSEGEDMVDSDFDKPEDENEGEMETESTRERGGTTKRKIAPLAPRPKAHPKPKPVKEAAAAGEATTAQKGEEEEKEDGEMLAPAKKYKRITAEIPLPLEQRSVAVRQKTIQQTKEAQRRFAEWEKKQIEKEQKKQDEPKVAAPEKLSQIDQLKQAAITEQENLESLKLLQQIELTKQKQGYNKKEVPLATTIRSTQRIVNGHPKMQIMIPDPEHLYAGPNKPADATKKLLNKKTLQCAISGKQAHYLDPMTKMTYATKEAFKILREKFYQLEEEKLNQRIQALNELLSLKKDKQKRHKLGKADVDGPVPMESQGKDNNKKTAEKEKSGEIVQNNAPKGAEIALNAK